MQSEPKQITSVGDLIDVARGLEVGSRWWRGQSKACWELTPRVFRGENPAKLINRYLGGTKFPMTEERYEDRRFLEAARRFNREFRMSSSLFIDGVHKNSAADHVYFYVKAQHYGLPTRMLDWSTNPAIALFFASVHDVDYDGKMFSINPEMLVPNRIFPGDTGGFLTPISTNDWKLVKIIDSIFEKEDIDLSIGHPPISVNPDHRFIRLFQQGSHFTLHVSDPQKVPYFDGDMKVYIIPSGFKSRILSELRAIGINWMALFQDVEYVAKELRERFELD